MSSTTAAITTEGGREYDPRWLQEAIMFSTKHIVESQEAMLSKINEATSAAMEKINEATTVAMEKMLLRSTEASTAAMEVMLCKLLEIQAQNQQKLIDSQAEKQQQLLEALIAIRSDEQECAESSNHQNLLTDSISNATNAGNSDEAVDHGTPEDENEEICYEEDWQGLEPLVNAVEEDEWEKATEYVRLNQKTITDMWITRDLKEEFRLLINNALREYAAQWSFVKEILKVVTPETLEYKIPVMEFTILYLAVFWGNPELQIVKMLVEKSPKLTLMECNQVVPLSRAAQIAREEGGKEVIEYLYLKTRDTYLANRNEYPDPFTGSAGYDILRWMIDATCYGTALSFCKEYPEHLEECSKVFDLLKLIADKPYSFESGANLTWWERCIYSCIEVDIDRPLNYTIKEAKEKHIESSSNDVKRDEENLIDTLKDSSTSSVKETMRDYISVYFKHYLMRVPCIKHMYDQKLAHKQAVALVNYLLKKISDKTSDMSLEKLMGEFQKAKLMETALKYGTTELASECIKVFKYISYDGLGRGEYFLRLAIRERNETVYNMLCTAREYHYGIVLDDSFDTIAFAAAELPTIRQLNSVSCEAFQMQREIQWFKGVENYILQKDRFRRNEDGNTAHDVFLENHKDMMEKGEKWMKDTSGSCMLVGALVATVAFAAAFTAPGGNISDTDSSDNGIPVFLRKDSFMVFAIADALSLFSSVASVLMFLAVYTSRYSAEDFLKSLPQKLIIGLGTLFVSLASILVSFSAAFTIVLGDQFAWAPILVGLFGCVPVFLFGVLQFPLFVQMVYSTYRPVRLWKYIPERKETRFASWKKSARSWFKSRFVLFKCCEGKVL